MPPTSTESATPRQLALLYTVLAAIMLLPVLSVNVPCMGDTLNHLARVHILATIGQAPWLQRLYDPSWRLGPYLGLDVPVAALTQMMPIYEAGKIFTAICVLMPVAGAVAVRYAVHRRVGAGACLAFLLCYNYQLERGFLSFLFATLCALLLFAAWVATENRAGWRRSVAFSLPFLAVFMAHSFAAVAYCALVAGHEIGVAGRQRFRPLRAVSERWLAAAAQILPALVLAILFATSGHEVTISHIRHASLAEQMGALASPILFPNNPATVAILLFIIGGALLFRRHIRFAPALWPAALMVLAVAWFTPSVLFDATWGVNLRLPLVLAVVLVGAVYVAVPLAKWQRGAALACLVALLLTTSFSARAMLAALDRQVTEMRHLVSVLPRGTRLLVVDMPQACGVRRVAPLEMTVHLSLVAAIDRDAFIPFLFTGTTPLQVLPAWRDSTSPNAVPISQVQLDDGLTRNDPPAGAPAYGWGGRAYWLGWPAKFDYVLVQHFGCTSFRAPALLRLAASNDIADIYKIGGAPARP